MMLSFARADWFRKPSNPSAKSLTSLASSQLHHPTQRTDVPPFPRQYAPLCIKVVTHVTASLYAKDSRKRWWECCGGRLGCFEHVLRRSGNSRVMNSNLRGLRASLWVAYNPRHARDWSATLLGCRLQ